MRKRGDNFGSIVICMDIQRRKMHSFMDVIQQQMEDFSVGQSCVCCPEFLRRRLIYSTIKIADSKLSLIN